MVRTAPTKFHVKKEVAFQLHFHIDPGWRLLSHRRPPEWLKRRMAHDLACERIPLGTRSLSITGHRPTHSHLDRVEGSHHEQVQVVACRWRANCMPVRADIGPCQRIGEHLVEKPALKRALHPSVTIVQHEDGSLTFACPDLRKVIRKGGIERVVSKAPRGQLAPTHSPLPRRAACSCLRSLLEVGFLLEWSRSPCAACKTEAFAAAELALAGGGGGKE